MEIYHPRDEELIREMRRVRRADKRKRLAIGLAILLVLSIAAGLFVFYRYYQLAVVHGAAMGGTLPEGSLVLVRKPEAGTVYRSGDIILYEKRITEPIQTTILGPKGKGREYCEYVLYRDVGTTRQYYTEQDGNVTWVSDISAGQHIAADAEGTVTLDTENLQNGQYWLQEVRASHLMDLLPDPIPVSVNNPVRTQAKRVLAAPGERVVLSPYTETRVNSRDLDTSYTSGRTADAVKESRRIIVAKDMYFVQGDQLSLSLDSRETNYGTVSGDEVLGRAEFALWPLRCFGSLTGRSVTTGEARSEEAE